MNIALIGYGKMGKAIEEILTERGHSVKVKLDRTPQKSDLQGIDAAIEFSQPEAAFGNLKVLMENQIPTVSGTTGWTERLEEMKEICEKEGSAFIYASNFSLGVNLFFELNAHLAKLMSRYPEYKVEIEEIHHTMKLDKPSGTAITLAEEVIKNTELTRWESDEKSDEKTLPIYSKRIDATPGTHTVSYQSEIDEIEIRHTAHSRKGFALGAVLAAEWLYGKKGNFTMKDVLGLKD